MITITIDGKWANIKCESPLETRAISDACKFHESNSTDDEDITSLLFEEDSSVRVLKWNLDWFLSKISSIGEYKISNPEALEQKLWFDLDKIDSVLNKDILNGIELHDFQQMGIRKALLKGGGLIKSTTGSGKTEIAAGIIKVANILGDYPALFIVNSEYALNQTYKRLVTRYGDSLSVGRFGGPYSEFDAKVLIAIVNSVWSYYKKGTIDLLGSRKITIFDEVHHGGAISYSTLSMYSPSEIIFGISATPFNTLSHQAYSFRDLLLQGLTGPIIFNVDYPYLRDLGLAPYVFTSMIRYKSTKIFSNAWSKVYSQGIVNATIRNQKAVEVATYAQKLGLRTLILVKHHAHGDNLLELLYNQGVIAMTAYGGGVIQNFDPVKGKVRKITLDIDVLENFEKEGGTLIGSPVFDESIDLPSIDVVIIMSAGRSPIKVIQKAGRGMRGKGFVYIFDFIDLSHFYLKHQSTFRQKIYADEMGFKNIEYDDALFHMSRKGDI